MELTDINLRQVALVIKAHGEMFADCEWRSNGPLETQSRLIFVQDGQMYFRIEDKKYLVKKNQLMLIPENRHVEYGVRKDELVHCFYCNFNASFGEKSIWDYLDGDWVCDVDEPKKTAELFKRFNWVNEDNLILDFFEKKLSLAAILTEFLKKNTLHIKKTAENKGLDLSDLADYIRRNVNSTDIINIDHLAKRAHIHPSYLIREFKKQFGKSPMQFVLEERVKSAKRQLSDTTLSIGAIAENMSFANAKYFSKFFKRRTGMTPSEFRKQTRGINNDE